MATSTAHRLRSAQDAQCPVVTSTDDSPIISIVDVFDALKLTPVSQEGLNREFDWEEAYEKESPILYGYLVKKVGAQAAEDIMQESFLRVFDMTQKKKAPRNFRAYLFQVARNLVAKRGFQNEEPSNLEENNTAFYHTHTGEESLAQKEITETLKACLKHLDTREAEVIDFRWSQGMSSEEIAVIIKTSDRHVRRILTQGTRKLEACFKSKGWEAEHVLAP